MATNPLDLTPTEVRVLMQFQSADLPSDADMQKILEFVKIKLTADIGTSSTGMYRYCQFLLIKAHIMKALASHSIAKGYIMVEAEGRKVKKAYEELKAEADALAAEYKQVVNAQFRSEVTMTMPIANSVSSEISEAYAKIMQGINNAEQYEKTQYYDSTRSTD